MSSLINLLIKNAFSNENISILTSNITSQNLSNLSSSYPLSIDSNQSNESIEQADQLIISCQKFITSANTSITTLPFQVFTRFRNWRIKRKEHQLSITYEDIKPKIKDIEKKLRILLNSAIEKKNALKYQAKYLLIRLEACIVYNKTKLEQTTKPVDEIRSIVNKISSELSYLKSMLSYNTELIRLKGIQSISTGQSFLPWQSIDNNNDNNSNNNSSGISNINGGSSNGSVTNNSFTSSIIRNVHKPITDAQLESDDDYIYLTYKLTKLRELRNAYVTMLSTILEQRETYTSNLEASEHSFHQLMNLIRRDIDEELLNRDMSKDFDGNPIQGLIVSEIGTQKSIDYPSVSSLSTVSATLAASAVYTNYASYSTPQGVLSISFDHNRCADCSIGHTISSECISNLTALQTLASQANSRLQVLVELRERMNEIAMTLEDSTHSNDDNSTEQNSIEQISNNSISSSIDTNSTGGSTKTQNNHNWNSKKAQNTNTSNNNNGSDSNDKVQNRVEGYESSSSSSSSSSAAVSPNSHVYTPSSASFYDVNEGLSIHNSPNHEYLSASQSKDSACNSSLCISLSPMLLSEANTPNKEDMDSSGSDLLMLTPKSSFIEEKYATPG